MKKYIFILFLIFTVNSIFGQSTRKSEWATPVTGISLKNMYKVDKGVYRSAQPSEKNFLELKNFGIKEVLNLRSYHSDRDENEKAKLILHRVKMDAHDIDTDEVIAALRIIKNRKGSILIHCKHGSDRTGLIVAMYRIVFQNWSKKKAIDEMKNGGYGHHSIFRNIPSYINKINVSKIKKELNN
ncbi:dual specificity protein phosphatase family protein [Dysgonomonas sp. 520]|uniref:dual specificity protein phosphatase family protein n=1 Tax=Dysgonomonas sp. 520 TaxID=2302931 RepID=UPI0013CF9A8F|nr:dual specificity protein phosphatase family protein [Dysgonomonas sp. 520]NDW08889.1 protein tyrosine phosphatase [Dysgonomonas sp. 520]